MDFAEVLPNGFHKSPSEMYYNGFCRSLPKSCGWDTVVDRLSTYAHFIGRILLWHHGCIRGMEWSLISSLYSPQCVFTHFGVTQPLEELRLGTLPYYYHNIQAFHPTLFFLQESSFFSSLLFCLHYCVEIFFRVPWLLAAIITLLFIRFTSQDPRSTIFYTFF